MAKNSRGLEVRKFEDCDGYPFEVSESSLADAECIWLSPSPRAMTLAKNAERVQAYFNGLTLNGGDGTGWIEIPLPEEVSIHDAILIDRNTAKVLSDELAYFAEHGRMRDGGD